MWRGLSSEGRRGCRRIISGQVRYKHKLVLTGLECRGDMPATAGTGGDVCVPAVGTFLEATRRFTQADVDIFTAVTGDANSIHAAKPDGTPAEEKGVIVPGHFVASMIPAMIGSHVVGAIYKSQTLDYTAPVWVDDAVTMKISVLKVNFEKKIQGLTPQPIGIMNSFSRNYVA